MSFIDDNKCPYKKLSFWFTNKEEEAVNEVNVISISNIKMLHEDQTDIFEVEVKRTNS